MLAAIDRVLAPVTWLGGATPRWVGGGWTMLESNVGESPDRNPS